MNLVLVYSRQVVKIRTRRNYRIRLSGKLAVGFVGLQDPVGSLMPIPYLDVGILLVTFRWCCRQETSRAYW